MLACLRALALPELPDAALQALGARSDALGAAIAPRLNAMRNDGHVKGTRRGRSSVAAGIRSVLGATRRRAAAFGRPG